MTDKKCVHDDIPDDAFEFGKKPKKPPQEPERKMIPKSLLDAEKKASEHEWQRILKLIDNAIAHELSMSSTYESASDLLKREHAVVVLRRLKGAIIP